MKETFVMRHGMVICSTAEARRWEDDGCIDSFPAPGDTVIRFRDNAPPEIGRVGVRAAMVGMEIAPIADIPE